MDKQAVDVVTFVDGSLPSGPASKDAWDATRRTTSTLSYLGLQDAPRKRRDSCQAPGGWAGGVVRMNDEAVAVLVSEDKWNKLKSTVAGLKEMVAAS